MSSPRARRVRNRSAVRASASSDRSVVRASARGAASGRTVRTFSFDPKMSAFSESCRYLLMRRPRRHPSTLHHQLGSTPITRHRCISTCLLTTVAPLEVSFGDRPSGHVAPPRSIRSGQIQSSAVFRSTHRTTPTPSPTPPVRSSLIEPGAPTVVWVKSQRRELATQCETR